MKQNTMIYYSAASVQGSRDQNQDNLGITGEFTWARVEKPFSRTGQIASGELRIFSICDGIGGAAMGDLASRNALMGVQQYLLETKDVSGDLRQQLLCAAEAAQRQVQAMFRRLRCRGGCTLTMLAIRDTEYALVNVGDSPAFLLGAEEREIRELSQRHNLASIKNRMGLEPGYGDECRLVHYLGKEEAAADMAYVTGGTLRIGDRFLLCSDGVTNALSSEELQQLLLQDVSAGEMVGMAAGTDGSDNCTAIHLKLSV